MRKAAFLLLSLCIFALSSKSQKIRVGVNAGISFPDLRSNSDNELSKDYTSRFASVFGAFADFGISNNLSIKACIDYAGQGGKRNGMQPVTNLPPQLASMLQPGQLVYAVFDNTSVLNYLEIPVMVKMEWGNSLHFYVNLGPYAGFLLNSYQKTNGNSRLYLDKGGSMPIPDPSNPGQPLPPMPFNAKTDVKSSLKNMNFGLTGGGGISKNITKSGELVLDVRAAEGFTTIQKNPQTDGKSHTGGLFVTLGYALLIGR
ncbi:MAG: hypothetical protein B6D37_01735 [Sphingobacteriales bacterium UTBCD1]|jgi:hypothetical protein|nr:MAG: hypothetical protein B6D37_01735 [Sphingobacteriales bacterium UTBCD1]